METAAATAPKPLVAATAPKPLITANQVTFARLALLPIGGYLIYQGLTGQWIALVFLTILGCTDFVDGYLARRYGTTVLGGLMDPIADKVFLAIVLFPMCDPAIGWLPPAWMGALLVREFVVTAARTSYQRRDITLRSSYLAKVKTWVQMSAAAVFFLARVASSAFFLGFLAVLTVAPLVAAGVFYLVRRRWWRGAFVFCGCFGALLVCTVLTDPPTCSLFLLVGTVALTWYTGGSYLTGIRSLVRRRPLDAADWFRLVGAITLPVAATALLGGGYLPAWPIIAIVCLEFAMGGLDNLLVHDDAIQSGTAWGARVIGESVLLGAAFVLARRGAVPTAVALTYAAFGLGAVLVSLAFWRHRQVYLASKA
ncbi:MAG: CDP-alcohol phosphatidyltransferase family protein [Deltaproteobacteria bacterium]|nr:CDP-alcohol phosphatidyltransferase family protein [Deltaproteobacteria bacterium]